MTTGALSVTARLRGASATGPVANRSVLRALSVLDLLSRNEGPMTLVEVATQLKLPKSSTLTLLRALVMSEFCVTDDKGQYGLGLRSFEVGAAYLRSMTPVRSVTPELEWLTESLGVTSHFAVLEHDEVVYLAKHDPPGLGLKLASSLGARLPAAFTAVGKAQLAFRRVPERAGASRPRGAPAGPGAWPRADHAVANAGAGVGTAEIEPELERVRATGYAVDDGQTAVGIRCVAAPVFDDRGCCGAIGVSYLIGGAASGPTVEGAVVEAAGRASARLGGPALAGKPKEADGAD